MGCVNAVEVEARVGLRVAELLCALDDRSRAEYQASMSDHTPHQKKIIGRYYDNLADIKLGGLSELVSELFLAESDSQRNRLWKRVAKAMAALKVPPDLAERILKPRTLGDMADPNALQRLQARLLAGAQSRRVNHQQRMTETRSFRC